MYVAKKPQLCLCSLRSLNDRHLTWILKIIKEINEYYILQRVDFSTSTDNDQKIDSEHFIKINQLYEDFYQRLESLSSVSIKLWNGFNSEDINP